MSLRLGRCQRTRFQRPRVPLVLGGGFEHQGRRSALLVRGPVEFPLARRRCQTRLSPFWAPQRENEVPFQREFRGNRSKMAKVESGTFPGDFLGLGKVSMDSFLTPAWKSKASGLVTGWRLSCAWRARCRGPGPRVPPEWFHRAAAASRGPAGASPAGGRPAGTACSLERWSG